MAAPRADLLAVPGVVELVPGAVLVDLEPDPGLLAAELVHPVPLREHLAVALPRLAVGVRLTVGGEELAPLDDGGGGGGDRLSLRGRLSGRSHRQTGDGHRTGQRRDRKSLTHFGFLPQ